MKKKGLPAWLLLMIITLAAGVLLGATFRLTEERINRQLSQQAEAVRQALVPQAADFVKLPVDDAELYQGVDENGNAVGYVSVHTVKGFGGDVEITVGTDADGVLNGISVGGANFSETAGLGAKSKEPAFQEQFAGKRYPLDLKKNGGEIDAITAATITSTAVVRGVNESLKTMADAGCFTIKEPAKLVDELGDGRYAMTVQGFGGPVYVELTLDHDAITAIKIGDDRFAETPAFGGKTQEESFYGQFIGKTGPGLKLGEDIEAVSGATITSTAVTDAVNQILLYAADPAAFAAAQEAAEAVPAEGKEAAPAGAYADGEYTIEGKGLTAPLYVTVKILNGAVESVSVEGTKDSMDNDYLQKCQTEEYLSAYAGQQYPVSVDSVSGATVSSKAILAAVNAAFEEAAQAETAEETDEEPAPVEEAEAEPQTEETAAYADGEYTVEGQGLTAPLYVTVKILNGAVEAVSVEGTKDSMDNDYLQKCQTEEYLGAYAGQQYPVSVDSVSGATVSSKAILAAVNAAFEAAAQAETTEETEEASAGAYNDGEYTIEGKGLTAPLYVTVKILDGAVEAVSVEGTKDSMDLDYLKKCQTEEYLNAYAGQQYPVAVDGVSGATVSSEAILTAVNAAFEAAAR